MPAVATTTVSGRGAAGRHTTVVPVRSPPGLAARAASAWASSARVSRIGGCPPRSSSSDDDGRALLGRLARGVDRLGHALAQGAVVVDPGEAEVGVGQPPEPGDRVVGRHGTDLHGVEQPAQGILVHGKSMLLPWPRPRMRAGVVGNLAPCRVTD